MKPHKHAELMMEYAKDAMETETPWERWEYFDNQVWRPLRQVYPIWFTNTQYRRKPKTININGHEVPEPYRGEMSLGVYYYTPILWGQTGYDIYTWDDASSDKTFKSKGLIHLSKEAAIAHANALISFTINDINNTNI